MTADALALEQAVLARYPELAEGLEQAGIAKARRALRVSVADLQWTFLDGPALALSFTLPAGCYATALLREIVKSQ